MSKFGMLFRELTNAKESMHIQVKSEMHACVLFFIPWLLFTRGGFVLDRQTINITANEFLKD
jgi:hypothetical protein